MDQNKHNANRNESFINTFHIDSCTWNNVTSSDADYTGKFYPEHRAMKIEGPNQKIIVFDKAFMKSVVVVLLIERGI